MRNNNSKMLAGLLLIMIGLFALSVNFFNLPFHFTHYIFSAPGMMMIVGLFILINHNDNSLGALLVGIGGFWFLSRYSHLPIRYYLSEYWPILIILLGIYIILKNNSNKSSSSENNNGLEFDIDFVDEVAIFGGGEKSVNSQNFSGGKVTTIFGRVDLDLHSSTLAVGTNILGITAMFGNIDITVPKDWKVILSVTSILGGYNDRRILNPEQTYEADKILIIKGTVIFGGGNLKTY
jgi:predicted membrane protein